MPLIVEEYKNRYAFSLTTESLGQIRVWQIEGIFLISAIRRNFETRSHIDGYPFMKVLVSMYATHLNLENERKAGEPITAEETEKLSPEEAEQIAEEILKHHTYLFTDRGNPILKQVPPDEQRELTVEISKRQIDLPRNEGELASDYLYRLVLALSEREVSDLKAAFGSVSEIAKRIADINSNFANSFKAPDYYIPPPPPNPQHTTNKILNSLLEQSARQNNFNEASVNSIVATASSVERIEKRVESWEKKSDESLIKSGTRGRINIWIQVILGLIAVLALILSYMSYRNSLKPQIPPPQVSAPASPESPQGEVK